MVVDKLLRVYAIERKPFVEIAYFGADDVCLGHKTYHDISSASWKRVSTFLSKHSKETNLSEHNGTVLISLVSEYM